MRAPDCCFCSPRGRARGTTAATSRSVRASPLLSGAGRCLRLCASLPAVVREAVEHVLKRDEESGVDHGERERARKALAPVSRADEVDEYEDHGAENPGTLRRTLPGGRRRNPDRAAAALLRCVRLGLGLRLGAVALLGFLREVFGRLLELVSLRVDPHRLVLVPAFLLQPAALLPRGHGGLA